jgi:hypothetical protein
MATSTFPTIAANGFFIDSSPGLPIRQRTSPGSSPPAFIPLPAPSAAPTSLIEDPVFKVLYADNPTNLRHFLETQAALERADLKDLFKYVESRGEPGARIQYANIPWMMKAMRPFLDTSGQGAKIIKYYREVLRIRGNYILTTAEMLAYEIVVKMTQALFIYGNDKQLRSHICRVVPEAQLLIRRYNEYEISFFNLSFNTQRLAHQHANAVAIRDLLNLKESEDFSRKHRQLLKANETHETKLRELRQRSAKRKAERKAKLQALRERNDAGLHRQMGMSGLTPLTLPVAEAVVDFVEGISTEYFPHADQNVYSEEHLVSD